MAVVRLKPPSCSVFFGNLKPEVTEQHLRELGAQAGQVTRVSRNKDAAFGFVEYGDVESAIYCVALYHGLLKLFDQPVTVNFSNSPVDQVSTAGQQLLDRCSKLLQISMNMHAANSAGVVRRVGRDAPRYTPYGDARLHREQRQAARAPSRWNEDEPSAWSATAAAAVSSANGLHANGTGGDYPAQQQPQPLQGYAVQDANAAAQATQWAGFNPGKSEAALAAAPGTIAPSFQVNSSVLAAMHAAATASAAAATGAATSLSHTSLQPQQQHAIESLAAAAAAAAGVVRVLHHQPQQGSWQLPANHAAGPPLSSGAVNGHPSAGHHPVHHSVHQGQQQVYIVQSQPEQVQQHQAVYQQGVQPYTYQAAVPSYHHQQQQQQPVMYQPAQPAYQQQVSGQMQGQHFQQHIHSQPLQQPQQQYQQVHLQQHQQPPTYHAQPQPQPHIYTGAVMAPAAAGYVASNPSAGPAQYQSQQLQVYTWQQ